VALVCSAQPGSFPFLYKSSTQQRTCASPSPFISFSLTLLTHSLRNLNFRPVIFPSNNLTQPFFSPLTLSHITSLRYTFHNPIKAHFPAIAPPTTALCSKHSRHHLPLPNLLSFSSLYLFMDG